MKSASVDNILMKNCKKDNALCALIKRLGCIDASQYERPMLHIIDCETGTEGLLDLKAAIEYLKNE